VSVRVVLVDDQEPFLAAARATVARVTGFELVAEARSGEEALALCPQLAPDLVLMDINMGGIDGIETTRRLTASDPHPVVLLMSTYDARDLPARAADCGAASYLHKDELSIRRLRQAWSDAAQDSSATPGSKPGASGPGPGEGPPGRSVGGPPTGAGGSMRAAS
jgi:DNA-binding NarL/FixJ family response regulator